MSAGTPAIHNDLSMTHMGAVGDVLSRNCRSLQVMALSNNSGVGDEGLSRVGEGLRQLQQLNFFNLRNLGLTHHSGHPLADIISNQPALQKIHLADNDLRHIGYINIVPALEKCQNLEELHLWRPGLTSSSMELLASVLTELPRRKLLDLRGIQMNANGFEQGLQQCPQLEILYLDDSGLTDHGQVVPWLTLVLLSLPQLKSFSLSRNQIGDSGLGLLSVGLEECHQLTEIWLDNIGMTLSESMSTISCPLKRLNRLQRLNFTNNPYTGSSTDMQLCTAVKGHPPLETLCVPSRLSDDAVSRLESFEHDSTCVLKSSMVW